MLAWTIARNKPTLGDGHSAYDQAAKQYGLIHCGCIAHARRKLLNDTSPEMEKMKSLLKQKVIFSFETDDGLQLTHSYETRHGYFEFYRVEPK